MTLSERVMAGIPKADGNIDGIRWQTDGHTLTFGHTLMVQGDTLMVRGHTLVVRRDTLMVRGDTLTITLR